MASGRQKHILLVEDDEDTLSATTAMLERLGYSVRPETESLKALSTFSEEPDRFDLALLDHGRLTLEGWNLPGACAPSAPVSRSYFIRDTLTDPRPKSWRLPASVGRLSSNRRPGRN
ncbi:MAG: hypothetical protein ABSC55_26570 [Syntrophorhabdales bacterium]